MTRKTQNTVKVDRFAFEALTAYLESKRMLYGWWVCLGLLAGGLGAMTFSRELNYRWWIVPIYLAIVLGLKRGLMHIARRLFPGESWWVATNVFPPAFLLASLGPAVSGLTSWRVFAIPFVIGIGFLIGLLHSAFRVVFVQDHFTWIWSNSALGAVLGVVGWVLVQALAPLTLGRAAGYGATIGLLYILLSTLLLEYMWNATSALAQRALLSADKHGEFIEAFSYLDTALSLEPHNASLYALRAEIYCKQGDLERAHAEVEHALSLDTHSPEANVMRANLLLAAQDFDAAIATYDEVIAKHANFYPAYLNRARAHSLKGNFDRAWDNCNRAARLAQDRALVQVTYGDINYRMGNYDEALQDCDQTIGTSTITPVAWAMALVIRAKCQIIKGEYEAAAVNLKAVLMTPFDAAVRKEAEEILRSLPDATEEQVGTQHEAV